MENNILIPNVLEYLIKNNLPLPYFLFGDMSIIQISDLEIVIKGNALFDKKQLGGREHINTVHYGNARNNLFRVFTHNKFLDFQPLILESKSKAHKLQQANTKFFLEGKLKNIIEEREKIFVDYEFDIYTFDEERAIIFEEIGKGILISKSMYLNKLKSTKYV